MKLILFKVLTIVFLFAEINQSKAQIVFQETFPGNVLPAGWQLDSAGQIPVNNWWNCDVFGAPLTGSGFDNSFAHVTFPGGLGAPYNKCALISPSFDASLLSTVYLSYADWGGTYPSTTNKLCVEISNDGGLIWNTVFVYNGGHGQLWTGYRNVIDITQYAAGQSNVKVRFYASAKQYTTGLCIDSLVVNDYQPCNSPPDSMGRAANIRSYACTGSPVQLRIDNLSRGAGQTYQWQYNNASTGNTWVNMPGAIYDTATFTQNGNTIYQCQVTCGGSTVLTDTAYVRDTPNQTSSVVTTNGAGICAAKNDTIYIVSEKNIPGLGYQWQQAPSAFGTYTDIAGANDTLYAVTAANHPANTWFKCKEICLSNGNYQLSPYKNEYVNPNPYCYCIDVNNNPCPPSPAFAGTITNVNILGTTLNNSSNNCNNVVLPYNSYMYYPPAGNATATLSRGSTYTISVTNDTIIGMRCLIWIDYDGNGSFDSSEHTYISQMILPGGSGTASFTVPLTATPGLTGMRVRLFGTGPYPAYPFNASGACWSFNGGETEDYMVLIDSALGLTPGPSPKERGVTLLPNPARDEVTVSSNDIIKDLKILSASGQEVYALNNLPEQKHTVSTKHLHNGVYYVVAATDKGRVVRKLVVVKD